MWDFIRRNSDTLTVIYIVCAVGIVALIGYLFGDYFGIGGSGFTVGWLAGIIFAVASLGLYYVLKFVFGALGDRLRAFRTPTYRPGPAAKPAMDANGRVKRLDDRESDVDGTVEIFGQAYPIKNWSPSGFVVSACDLKPEPGVEVPIHLSVSLDGKRLEVDCKCLVVRVEHEPRELAGMFVMLGKAAYEDISRHFR